MTTGIGKRSAHMHWRHIQYFLRIRSHMSKRLELPGDRQAEGTNRNEGGHIFGRNPGGAATVEAF